jgi:hypothetical protein
LAVLIEDNSNPLEELESPNLLLRLNRYSKRYIFHTLGFGRKNSFDCIKLKEIKQKMIKNEAALFASIDFGSSNRS